MVRVFSEFSEGRRGHDISSRVNFLPAAEKGIKRCIVRLEIEGTPRDWAKSRHEILPGVDPIEHLKQERSKENLVRALIALVENVANKVLANSIRRSVCVCKPVTAKDGVGCPRWLLAEGSFSEYLLSLGGESPVSI
jgi:hypothetical protein